jgi:hypothetical protein
LTEFCTLFLRRAAETGYKIPFLLPVGGVRGRQIYNLSVLIPRAREGKL